MTNFFATLVVFALAFVFLGIGMIITGKARTLKSCGGVGEDCEFCPEKQKCKFQDDPNHA